VLRARLPLGEVIRLGSTAASAEAALQALQPGAASESGATRHCLIVGDADDWAANWSLAHAARSRATIIVHGGQAEFRSLARANALPPLLDDPVTQCWMAEPGHSPTRRAWFAP
jgi:DNA segregation ATPase FtsK/SpoIIIE, S-DNA-T family